VTPGSNVRDAAHKGMRLTYYDHACPTCGSTLASKDHLLLTYKCHACGRESAKSERPAAVNDWSVLEPSAPPFVVMSAKWRGGIVCDACGKKLYLHGGEVRFGHLRLTKMCNQWVRSEPTT
jgi:ribosomal protein L37AE/L43A